MTRIVKAIFILCVSFALTACWDMVEISRASLITGIALEPGQNGRVKLTLEVLNTAETVSVKGGKGGSPAQLYSNESETIVGALIRMNEKLDMNLIGSHVRVIIIDERLAREGLEKFIDFVQRSRYIREDVTLLISNKTKASDMLRVAYPDGMYAGLGIQSQIDNYHRNWGGVPKSFMYEIAQTSLSVGRELMLGAVTLLKHSDKEETIDNAKTLDPQTLVQVTGAAVFKSNRLIGFLPPEETSMALLVTNRLRRTTLSVPLKKQGKYAAIRLVHYRTSNRVRIIKCSPVITVKVNAIGLVGSLDSDVPLDKVKGYEQLDRLTEQYLRDQIETTITKVQKDFKSDIFGFGQTLYRHHYGEFVPVARTWNEQFAQAKVIVQTSVKIERSELQSNNLSNHSVTE